jgi:hypothetical protein
MMRERDRSERLDNEEFVHCLGAFLAAARTVVGALPRAIRGFNEKAWLDSLPGDEANLYRALVAVRDIEVHDGHADKAETLEHESAWRVLAKGATPRSAHSFVMPAFVYDEGATIAVKRYWFEIDGVRVPVVQQCERWLRLLQEALAVFVAAGQLPPG